MRSASAHQRPSLSPKGQAPTTKKPEGQSVLQAIEDMELLADTLSMGATGKALCIFKDGDCGLKGWISWTQLRKCGFDFKKYTQAHQAARQEAGSVFRTSCTTLYENHPSAAVRKRAKTLLDLVPSKGPRNSPELRQAALNMRKAIQALKPGQA